MDEAEYKKHTMALCEFLKSVFPTTEFTWDESGKTWWTSDMRIVNTYSVFYEAHDRPKLANLKLEFYMTAFKHLIVIPDFDKIGFTID